MRLIDADLAAEMIRDLAKEPDYQHEDEDWRDGLGMAGDALNDIPTVEGYCNVEKLYDELNACSYPSLCGWAISMDSVRRVLRKYLKED